MEGVPCGEIPLKALWFVLLDGCVSDVTPDYQSGRDIGILSFSRLDRSTSNVKMLFSSFSYHRSSTCTARSSAIFRRKRLAVVFIVIMQDT